MATISTHERVRCSQYGSKHPKRYAMGVVCDFPRFENAPATFNRVVAHVMRQQRAYAPHVFDDVFVLCRAENGLTAIESHKRHLEAVLQTLGDAKFTSTYKSAS